MPNSAFYPEDLKRGDEIEIASTPDCGESKWALATVTVLKTDSCDAVLADGQYRHDVLYLEDPRIGTTKLWAETGRGIFRISQAEIRRREMYRKVNAFGERVVHLERQMEAMVLRAGK